MSKKMRANLLLLITAFIWGVAFVAQDVAADVLQPFTFNGLRMLLGALAMTPIMLLMDRRAEKNGKDTAWRLMSASQRKTLLLGGACCGTMLMLGSVTQQIGIGMGTSVGKAGFISALYIILVPVLGLLFGRRLGVLGWIAVGLGVAGLYFLCIQGSIASIDPGDGMIMLSALCYSGHILVVDHFTSRADGVKLSVMQSAITAVLSLTGAALFEQPTWDAVRQCTVPLLYAGVLSVGIAYTLQILGQKDAQPAVASLLMSLESVFAVLAGWVLLGNALSPRELLGCGLMMGGIVLAQLPRPRKAG